MKEKEIIVTWSRASSIILPAMVGYTIAIHNGKEYITICITNLMVHIGGIHVYSALIEFRINK